MITKRINFAIPFHFPFNHFLIIMKAMSLIYINACKSNNNLFSMQYMRETSLGSIRLIIHV
jgi:hypothetical protein